MLASFPTPSRKEIRIKFPAEQGTIFKNRCAIFNKKTPKVLAGGWMGETLSFACESPTQIYVFVGGRHGKPETTAFPGDRFEVVFRGIRSIGLQKVDIITGDS